MARIRIGNIKGPAGPKGATGATGPQGVQGPQGPLPPLTNNGLATVAGVSALDAVMGKTLQDQITRLNSEKLKTKDYVVAVKSGYTVSEIPVEELASTNIYSVSVVYNEAAYKYKPVVFLNTGNKIGCILQTAATQDIGIYVRVTYASK